MYNMKAYGIYTFHFCNLVFQLLLSRLTTSKDFSNAVKKWLRYAPEREISQGDANPSQATLLHAVVCPCATGNTGQYFHGQWNGQYWTVLSWTMKRAILDSTFMDNATGNTGQYFHGQCNGQYWTVLSWTMQWAVLDSTFMDNAMDSAFMDNRLLFLQWTRSLFGYLIVKWTGCCSGELP